MRFVDTIIFIKWGQAAPAEAAQDEKISLCGYILSKIRNGEEALTSTLTKDEALIWFSRYKASRLSDFVRSLTALTSMTITHPSLEDELEATQQYGQYPLGISDLINLSIMKRHRTSEIDTTDQGFEKVPTLKRIFEDLKKEPEYNRFVTKLKSRHLKP
jgi:predicted nucleic acid-binding protein